MKSERFNELLNGPLQGPTIIMTINRLALALLHVLQVTGEAGDRALEGYCKERDERDQRADG